MVSQSQENGSLSWVQNGQPINIIKEDTLRYSPALETLDAQLAAIEANKDAEDAYMQDLRNQQEQVDASRPIEFIPVKPPYVVVSDPHYDGTTVTPGVRSHEPWPDPGLPELKHKTIYPSGSSTPIEEPFVFADPAAAPKSSTQSTHAAPSTSSAHSSHQGSAPAEPKDPKGEHKFKKG